MQTLICSWTQTRNLCKQHARTRRQPCQTAGAGQESSGQRCHASHRLHRLAGFARAVLGSCRQLLSDPFLLLGRAQGVLAAARAPSSPALRPCGGLPALGGLAGGTDSHKGSELRAQAHGLFHVHQIITKNISTAGSFCCRGRQGKRKHMVQVAISRIFALTLLLKRADINYFVKKLRPAAD